MSSLARHVLRFLSAVLILGAADLARADNVIVTYSAAGQTSPQFGSICNTLGANQCSYGLENFKGFSSTSGVFTSAFTSGGSSLPTGGSFSGTYTAGTGTSYGSGGAWISQAQNQYGGVNGNPYPELFGCSATNVTNKCANGTVASYTLNLSTTGLPGINYFGIWISALDQYNSLAVYSGSTQIAYFNAGTLQAQLGTCNGTYPNASNPYCGNPTSSYLGQNAGEMYVYVNVFDLTGYITKVVFQNSGTTGFESSNHAVAYGDPLYVTGTPIPEPSAAALLVVGALGVAAVHRGRSSHTRG